MSEFLNSIEEITLIYNIALLAAALFFFIILFKIKKTTNIKPWKMLFLFTIILLIKQLANLLRFYDIIKIQQYIGAFFDFTMAILLVYAFMLRGEKK